MTEPINPAKAWVNLLNLAAGSLEDGDHGTNVTVDAWDLAALLRESARQWAEIADAHTPADDPAVITAAGRIDPAVRIANDLADRTDDGPPTPGGGDRPHLELSR